MHASQKRIKKAFSALILECPRRTNKLIVSLSLQAKAMGKVLFEQVCRQLNLLEADYFGLEYQEHGSNTKVRFKVVSLQIIPYNELLPLYF